MSSEAGGALATRLAVLGAISVAAFVAVAVLAPGLAGFAPLLVLQGDEIAFVDRLAGHLRWLPGAHDYLRTAVRGGLPLGNAFWRALAASLPLGVASVAMLLAVRELQHDSGTGHHPSADRIARWVAVLLALVAVFGFPTYTPDFWLSIAWGRMLAEGQNPYYAPFTTEVFQGILGGHFEPQDRLTYGPLWALVIGGLGRLAGRQVFLEFFLHKLVLAGAWLGSIAALRQLAGRRGPDQRLLVTCLIGWLPAGVYFAVAEGHNDMVMVLFVCLWLGAVDRGDHRLTPVWLACSCLIKFITLPLIGLELLAAQRAGVLFTRRYLLTLAACGLCSLLVLSAFYEGPGFLEPTRQMQNWVFWVPSYYLVNVAALAGVKLPITTVDRVATILAIALTGLMLWRAVRRPAWDTWVTGGLAVMACMLLTLVGHVWPWFALWLLPFLAVLWPTRTAGVLLTFLLMVPFLDLGWILAPDWQYRPIVGIPVYSSVLLVMVFLWRRGPAAMGHPPGEAIR